MNTTRTVNAENRLISLEMRFLPLFYSTLYLLLFYVEDDTGTLQRVSRDSIETISRHIRDTTIWVIW